MMRPLVLEFNVGGKDLRLEVSKGTVSVGGAVGGGGQVLSPGPTGLITIDGGTIDVDVAVLEETLTPQLAILLDDNGDFTYVGEAVPGTATSAASWRIFRLDNNPSGDEELTKLYANASINFDQVWDNRLSLSYS